MIPRSSTKISLPFRIASEDVEKGSRLGGRAPEGVEPALAPDLARYLLSIVLGDAQQEISVFLAVDYGRLFDLSGQIVGPAENAVDVIIHPPSVRSLTDRFHSDLSGHALVFGEPREDLILRENGSLTPRSSHKCWGQPYFLHGEPELESRVVELLTRGFRHVLQLDVPGSEDGEVDGNWPFADGVFHLLLRSGVSEVEWRTFWEV